MYFMKVILKKLSKNNHNDKIRFYEFNLMTGLYNKFGHLAEANGFKLIKNLEKNGFDIDASYKWNA